MLLSLTAHGLLLLEWNKPTHDLAGDPENSAKLHLSLAKKTISPPPADKPQLIPPFEGPTISEKAVTVAKASSSAQPLSPIQPSLNKMSPVPATRPLAKPAEISEPLETERPTYPTRESAITTERPPSQRRQRVVTNSHQSDSRQTTSPQPKTIPPPKTDQTVSRETRAMVRRALHKSFSESFRYPPVAIQNRWQGTVLLAFEVVPNGKLKKIEIKKPSGHPVLDQDAFETLTQIDQLTNITAPFPSTLTMELPVIYQLQS